MNNKYSDIRQNIKSGDILAWSSRKIERLSDISLQLIRIFTKSEYTHVGTAWVVNDRVFVIEATIPYVRICPLSSLIPFYWIKTNVSWANDTETFALSVVGEEYSIKQAILALIKKPNLDKNWQCAELVHEILLKDGVDLGNSYTPSEIVYNALRNSYSLKLIE